MKSVLSRNELRQIYNVSMYYVYMLRCSDRSLYTGWTNNIAKRVAQHTMGAGAKYTRSRRPVTLVYSEALGSRAAALRREHAIKSLSRAGKLALMQTWSSQS